MQSNSDGRLSAVSYELWSSAVERNAHVVVDHLPPALNFIVVILKLSLPTTPQFFAVTNVILAFPLRRPFSH